MDAYTATGNNTVTATPGDTTLNIFNSGTTTRGQLYDVMVSHSAASPSDNTIQWLVRRSTAVGTEGSGVVPAKLDLAAPAAQFDGAENHTGEPTYTAATEIIDLDVNMRATNRWVGAPLGEVILPATSNAGVGATPISSYTGDAATIFHWRE